MRLIDADYLKEFAIWIRDEGFDLEVVPLSDFEWAPTIDPVKHGRWTKGVVKNEPRDFIGCSVCGKQAYWDTDYGQQLFDFCPWCGASMREEVSE